MTETKTPSRPDPRLRIITEALKKADPFTPPATAIAVYTALYGRPTEQASPLQQAEDAKRRRDIGGEIDALMDGQRALESAPWYPARKGDVVHIAYEPVADHLPPFGETYVVVDDPEEGGLVLKQIAWTGSEHAVGYYAPGTVDDPLLEPWMEAGPATLTIVRDGRVVHGRVGPS